MRLRFWEPRVDPYQSFSPGGHMHIAMPARRINLTELDRFGHAMARAVGLPEEKYEVLRWGVGEDNTSIEVPVELDQLVGMLPDQRARVSLRAAGPIRPGAQGIGEYSPTLQLMLGDGLASPATLMGPLVDDREALLALWSQLGRPRRTWAWFYPALFLSAVAAGLVPFIVLWAKGALTLWLIPSAVLVVALAFAVCSPLLQARVKSHRESRAGLDIDHRLLQGVRTDRAVSRRNLLSGVAGAALGAAVALVGVWATLSAGGS